MWDRFLGFLGFEEVVEEDEAAAEPAPVAVQAGAAGVFHSREPAPRRPVRMLRTAGTEGRTESRGGTSSRGATVTRLVAGTPGLVVMVPKRFEEAQEAADHLRAGKPVIVHIEGVERELAQRLVNFLAGSTYALGGEMHRIGSVVLFAPAGVDVTLPLNLRLAERDGQ